MDAREFLGLTATHNPHRWWFPVTAGLSTGGGFLFGGCGLAAAIVQVAQPWPFLQACVAADVQVILNHRLDKHLPWGHYTLTLGGKGSMAVSFCKSFDVFVAPGSTSMTYELVVTPWDASADGGVCPWS